MSNLEKISHKITEIEKQEDGCRYNISIKVPMDVGFIKRMKFIVETTDSRSAFPLEYIKNEDGYAYFGGNIHLITKAIYHYYFSFEANGSFIYYKKEKKTNHQTITPEEKWQMSVNFSVDDAFQGGMMYQIMPDRFYKGRKEPLPKMPGRIIHKKWDEDPVYGPNQDGYWCTDFYGGDIKGIIEKLDYLKSLGINILYLNPLVLSQSNHRYDTADYEVVDPYVGTNNDLKELCDKAHKKGIKIVLDAVFNHTGNDSKYFNELNTYKELGAYQSKDSKYYQFYKKNYDGNKECFDYWWGNHNMPVCDGTNKEWQQYIYGEHGIIDLWFSLGIDGLRLDVPYGLTDEFLEGIRTAVKRNKKYGFILGEIWENAITVRRTFIETGKAIDTPMNYILLDALIRYFKHHDVNKLVDVIRQLKTDYPKDTLNSMMNPTSTHDTPRAINLYGSYLFHESSNRIFDLSDEEKLQYKDLKLTKAQYEWGKKLYMASVFFLASFPGNLSIYYGDEVGVQGMGDVIGRKPYPWNGPIDHELLNYFMSIASYRNREQFLRKADLEVYDINDRYAMYERIGDLEKSLTIVNRTDEYQKVNLPKEYEKVNGIYRLNNSNNKELAPFGGIVLKKR